VRSGSHYSQIDYPEKWIEDASGHFIWNTGAEVANTDRDTTTAVVSNFRTTDESSGEYRIALRSAFSAVRQRSSGSPSTIAEE